jgi:putative restriction endonuclease
MPRGKAWTREDTIIAYALYCVIPFSKVNNSNQTIKDAAEIIGRSPASLKMKICNLAALDPDFLASGRAGLWGGISKLDRTVFAEFSSDWQRLSSTAEKILGLPIFDVVEPIYNGPDRRKKKTYAEISDKQARRFFRKSVIAAYEGRCCISGMTIPQMLIASHIKPYAVSDKQTERANPANGLLLNAFYDRAFDQGLMTVLPDLTIRISDQVKEVYTDEKTRDWLYSVEGTKIKRPARFAPNRDLLAYHNEYVFLR